MSTGSLILQHNRKRTWCHGKQWGGVKTKVIGNNSLVPDWSRLMYYIGKAVTQYSLLHSQKITVVILCFWHLIPVTTHLRSSGQQDPTHRVRKQEATPSIVLCLMASAKEQDQHSACLTLSGVPQLDTVFFIPSPKYTAQWKKPSLSYPKWTDCFLSAGCEANLHIFNLWVCW